MHKSKQLILMRHAKSDWHTEHTKDFARPLNVRGRQAALQMGQYLKSIKIEPQLIVHSSAVRTSETATLVKQAAAWQHVILQANDALYSGDLRCMLMEVNKISDEIESLMIVGHEPTCSAFVNYVTAKWFDYPTATVALFDLPFSNWASLDNLSSSAKFLTELRTPKSLA